MHTGFLVSFLLWCAIANYGVLLLSFVAVVLARGWIHRLHGRWFGLSAAQLDMVMYSWLGAYKLAIWFFLIIPCAVLYALR